MIGKYHGEVVAEDNNFNIVYNPGYFQDHSGGFFYESRVGASCGDGIWGDLFHFKRIYDDERRQQELTGLGKELLAHKIAEAPMVLWDYFGDLPMNPETEEMEVPFMRFPEGTHREEIWKWFESTFPGFSVGKALCGE